MSQRAPPEPLVSIVVVNHNYGPYLGEAIESALRQTHQPIEVIVVDDGSTDDSLEVAGRYDVEVVSQGNEGVSSARNRGAARSSGELLVFLDADDTLEPTYVAECLTLLSRRPPEVAYVYTQMQLFGTEQGLFESRPFSRRFLVEQGNFVNASALMRRAVFLDVGGFDPSWTLGYEDYELYVRLLHHGYVGAFLEKPLIRYRRHGQSRNVLSDVQLDALRARLAASYPRLFASHLARHPLRSVRGWLRHRSLDGARPTTAPTEAQPPDPHSLAVVIVNWNGRDELAACLRSLEQQTDTDFEIIVVDNGSEDDSVALVEREFSDVKLIRAGRNLGFAEGCNRGIAATAAAWVGMLNNDAVADPQWIAELRAAVRSGGQRLGMIQSQILFKEHPDRTNSTGVELSPDAGFMDRDFDAPARDERTASEIFCVSAGAALFRRAMLDQVRLPTGVFDRTFFMYYEDVDLGWRARLAGWHAQYLPRAKVWHRFHGSSNRRREHFVRLQCAHNRVRLLLKNGSMPYVFGCARRLTDDVVWATRTAGTQALRGYAVAIRDGWRQRRAVTRLTSGSRRAVERRWVEP